MLSASDDLPSPIGRPCRVPVPCRLRHEARGEASLKTSFAAEEPQRKALKANDPIDMEPSKWASTDAETRETSDEGRSHTLAGRTLEVSSLQELKLADRKSS